MNSGLIWLFIGFSILFLIYKFNQNREIPVFDDIDSLSRGQKTCITTDDCEFPYECVRGKCRCDTNCSEEAPCGTVDLCTGQKCGVGTCSQGSNYACINGNCVCQPVCETKGSESTCGDNGCGGRCPCPAGYYCSPGSNKCYKYRYADGKKFGKDYGDNIQGNLEYCLLSCDADRKCIAVGRDRGVADSAISRCYKYECVKDNCQESDNSAGKVWIKPLPNNFTEHKGRDISGFDLDHARDTNVSDIEICKKRCDTINECAAFVVSSDYAQTRNFTCHYKKICGIRGSECKGNVENSNYTVFVNNDSVSKNTYRSYPKNDIHHYDTGNYIGAGIAKDCEGTCNTMSECIGFVHNRDRCYFKKRDTPTGTNNDWTTYQKQFGNISADFTELTSVRDTEGNCDVHSELDVEACKKLCLSTNDCCSFVHGNGVARGDDCCLKSCKSGIKPKDGGPWKVFRRNFINQNR